MDTVGGELSITGEVPYENQLAAVSCLVEYYRILSWANLLSKYNTD